MVSLGCFGRNVLYYSPHTRLAMVPEGRNRAASFSNSVATFSSKALGNGRKVILF